MTGAGVIEPHYVDALGGRHHAPAETIAAIRQAMTAAAPEPRKARGARANAARVSTEPAVHIIKEGTPLDIGPAELQLDDGATLTVDRGIGRAIPIGYHHIVSKRRPPARLIIVPATCYLPREYRTWGWAIQLYAARSAASWGIGDLADLRWLGAWARGQGAGLALINPLAAPTPTLPQQPSPYLPSSRRFRNPLYLRIEEIDGAAEVRGIPELARRATSLNRERIIDRDAIFRLKMDALERIWQSSSRSRPDRSLETFTTQQGVGLHQFAVFSALAERFQSGWHRWPAEYRHPCLPAVRRAAEDPVLRDRILFHQWVQYLIDRQLARASAALPVMQDLPIGFDPDGADAWAFQDVLAQGVSVGAPPDEFNTRGQHWGLPPFVPDKLRAAAYDPFVQTIRACLRHTGGLRIDHVMGLLRLFWIPAGMEPKDGAYVRSHADDLLGIVALESRRARAVIVGEDLGTVEEATRAQLRARQILSYRLVWFEKKEPRQFPAQALAAITTHDLPTIAGLWSGSDLAEQTRLGLKPNEQGTLLIRDRVRQMTRSTDDTPIATVIARLHRSLSAAPSRIVTATLDDAMRVQERPNMPATTMQRPNWSVALPDPIESLKRASLPRQIARALRPGRSRRKSGHAGRRKR